MQSVQLYNSDVRLPRLVVGLWGISGGDMWGEQDESDSISAIHAAIDAGLTGFDTAEGYGDGYSEQVLGKVVKETARENLTIATKVSPDNLAPADLRSSCEKSLKRLQTDYIDLYQIHWPNAEVPFGDSIEELGRLKSEGKIRAIGVSNFGPGDLDGLYAAKSDIATNQLAYSLLFRAIEHEIVPKLVEHGTSVIAYSALLHGILAGRYEKLSDVPDGRARTRHFPSTRRSTRHGEDGAEAETNDALDAIRTACEQYGVSMRVAALQWVLSHSVVAAALVGVRNKEQAVGNAALFETAVPDELIARLTEATEPLKRKLGPNADMWTSGKRMS